VAISDHTRKVLWSLSGNACARCDASLVRLPEAKDDVHAIVGRECHIVARSLAGPRGEAEPRGGIDDYKNLILLCANCHAVVDGQPERWTPDELRKIKREHEQKVAQRSSPSTLPKLEMRGRERPQALNRITSGDALVRMMDSAFSYVTGAPDGLSSTQRELVGDFLQSAQDWGECLGDIGPKGHMDAGQDLQDHIDGLRDEGLLVYGATRRLTLASSAGDESPWPESVLKVVHEHEARQSPDEEAASQ